MREKMISVLLAVGMVLSLLAGCASGNPAGNGEDPEGREKEVSATADASEQVTLPAAVETTEAMVPETMPVDTVPVSTESAPEETVPPTTEPPATEPPVTEGAEENNLTPEQRNSINMVNYITMLNQEINAARGNRMYLDSVKDSLRNDLLPGAIDAKTQAQINALWTTIDQYRMVSVKRERLEYIYEQNKAQALREAMPGPMDLLKVVKAAQSGHILEAVASVLYMPVDAITSYDRVSTQADLNYLQGDWELEDAEAEALSASQLDLLNYTIEMVRENKLDDLALNEYAVRDFVKWANEDNLVRKIRWLEENEKTYREFRMYWLVLAQSYYETKDYGKCLSATDKYEQVATHIFNEDHDFAETLPMVIVAAKYVMTEEEYIAYAEKYLEVILENCGKENWDVRYFAAQVYIDLSAITANKDYLEKAYQIAYANVNELVDEQDALNHAYMAEITEEVAEKDATKREKQEIKEYNKYIKEKRKRELPPVSEAFYLNCELLFALAEELGISDSEKQVIDATIHENGQRIFLTETLDNRFWASTSKESINSNDIAIEFDGEKIVIPANCLTERFTVTVSVSDGTVISDWKVEKVERAKNSADCSDFRVTLTSEAAEDHEYAAGDTITITVIPASDAPNNVIEFRYKVEEKTVMGFIKDIEMKRVILIR